MALIYFSEPNRIGFLSFPNLSPPPNPLYNLSPPRTTLLLPPLLKPHYPSPFHTTTPSPRHIQHVQHTHQPTSYVQSTNLVRNPQLSERVHWAIEKVRENFDFRKKGAEGVR